MNRVARVWRPRRVKLKRYSQLTRALAEIPCQNLVEIGTWNGRRAEELARAALRHNLAVTYHGFDLFEALTDEELEEELSKRPPPRLEVEARLRRFQRRASILRVPRRSGYRRFDFSLHQGHTRETLPAFRAANPTFQAQFIFIDGGHRVDTIRSDWENCSKLVDPRGAIFLDDFYGDEQLAERFGCNQLVRTLRANPAWDVDVLPATDRIEGLGTIQIVRVRPRR